MSRKKFVYDQLQKFIKVGDHTSVNHILTWEYQKDRLFDIKNDEGLTLIHTACLEGQLKCLDVLLKNGASVHTKSSVGWRALHAATLGGNLKVVHYLLSECSADPLDKDDMDCMASDLTMDKDILRILNKYADDAIIKKDIEALASSMALKNKRRTFSCDETNAGGKRTSRAQSMFCNKNEALQIRVQYARSKDRKPPNLEIPSSDGFLQIPNASSNRTDVNNNTTAKKSNSKTVSTEDRKISDPKARHNDDVIRHKSSTISNSSTSPTSPRAVKFFTLDRNRRKHERKNRDSGVFDDDNESDVSDTSKGKKDNLNHYKLI